MAKTLIYLKENGIDSYDELIQKSAAVSSVFNGKLKRIKEIETRQNEIKLLQYHIGNYGKSREIYKMYIRQDATTLFLKRTAPTSPCTSPIKIILTSWD